VEKSENTPVGIDLGTTFSVIAHLDREGRPATIRNAEGDATTPSAVFFDRSSVIVGKEAVKLSRLEPERVALCAKRDMGSPFYSHKIAGQQLPPEVIQACVLRKLREDAELVVGKFDKAVITVPAYFNEPRRKATQDAGRLAGLEVIDIINEPTAAAIAAGAQHGRTDGSVGSSHERILVFDLGGGTFDVTVMEIKDLSFDTLATGGDVHLGGIDWDRRLADHLLEEFQAQQGDDLREQPLVLARILREAEEAKRTLSARDEAMLVFEHEGARIRKSVTRAKFEDLTRDLVERTRFTATRVMRESGLKWNDLDRVLVVGGSTRMPMIVQMLEHEAGRKLDRSVSADEAVAHGAALYAELLLKGTRKSSVVQRVTNVSAHNMCVLGIDKQTGRRRSRIMIQRNSRLPASSRASFRTQQQGQTSVVVQIVEGGDASGNSATPIGRCVISGLPPTLPINAPVEVTFTYQPNGRLIVEAQLPDKSFSARTTIERASGLDETLLKSWQDKLESGQLLPDTADEPAADAEADDMDADSAEETTSESLDFGEAPAPRHSKPKAGVRPKTGGKPAASAKPKSTGKPQRRPGASKPPPSSKDGGLDSFLDSLE
jgi:molecular chaperone DnaK